MARAFSGVLAVLAFSLVVLRGVIANAPANQVLAHALVALLVFSAIGLIIGWIADKTVRESVENRFRAEVSRVQSAVVDEHSEKSEKQS